MADLHPEVLKMIEAGPRKRMSPHTGIVITEHPQEFARRCVQRAVELEREECAKVCEARATYWRESVAEGTEVDGYESQLLDETATIIRQRGKP